MQVHALQTGLLTVKRNYVTAKDGNRLMRLTSSLLDNKFIDIPVYVWVIEHPEGVIVIDVGDTAQANAPGSFPAIERPYWRSQYRFKIQPQQEIGAQLAALGIPPENVRFVVLTHAHFDHTGALYAFPNARFIISAKEWQDVLRYRSAHFALPSKYPVWFKPESIAYVPAAVGPFEQSYPLTKAGDVSIIPTPGHTLGHQSVILQDATDTIFFAGDTSFDQDSLLNGIIDAPAFNAQVLRHTRQRILDYARDTRLIYLPTHDHHTGERLAQRTALTS